MSEQYTWGDTRFPIPALEDESVLSFVDYEKDRAVASLTGTKDLYEGPLQAFVDAANSEFDQAFGGWTTTVETSSDVAIVLAHHGETAEGAQQFVRGFRASSGMVFCFTAVGAPAKKATLVAWVQNAVSALETAASA